MAPTPNFAAPNDHAKQAVRPRACDNDREAAAPEIPGVAIEAAVGGPLPWSGAGNVITACGAVLLGLAGRS